ncbi:MAG: agmatinase [Planctomycetaceae bacterium]|jgi:agmatinase|nr:agmatinase [Planctomycetaceae bacterium]
MRKTFFYLPPELMNPETARFHVLPVPYEGTVCFMHGAARGPDAILEVSDQIERIDETLQNEYVNAGIATYDPVPAADSPVEEMRRIYDAVRPLFRPGRFPIVLGGEHSITPPIVRAAAEVYPNLSVLQFDAHSDLRDEFTGGKYSHASAMRRVLEITPFLTQVGIRSYSAVELRECPSQINKRITVPMLETEEGLRKAVQKILDSLTDTVYITFDIDAFDPAYAPATGTPEPGGMTWRQATAILYEVSLAKKVIGADVVEVAPYQNGNITTEYLAARLVAKIMAFNC